MPPVCLFYRAALTSVHQQRKNEMTGQYSWWAIGIVLMLAYFFISVMGIAHEGAKVILR